MKNKIGDIKNKIFNINLIYSTLILISILMLSTLAYSEEITNKEETLIFLGNENLAPLIYKEDGITKGIVVDIVEELSKKIDRDIEVQAMNWKKAQDMVLKGQAHALLQINSNSEREELYDFSYKLLKSEFVIFKENENRRINGIKDLKNKKVGVEEVGYARCLLENYSNISIAGDECLKTLANILWLL